MHVVIMQARYHRAARGVEGVLAAARGQPLRHLINLGAHADVDDPPVQEMGLLDQHGTEFLCGKIASTLSLSAPGAAAVGGEGGVCGCAGGIDDPDRRGGSDASVAATPAIVPSTFSPPP